MKNLTFTGSGSGHGFGRGRRPRAKMNAYPCEVSAWSPLSFCFIFSWHTRTKNHFKATNQLAALVWFYDVLCDYESERLGM